MFWADYFTDQIIKSGKYKPYWVDDMKTPSGKIHVGSLRGVVIHDLLYKVLREKGKPATYTYCINDMDPMDGFPVYLDRDKFYKYMGYPLVKIPSPIPGFKSFAEYYAQEFIGVFNKIGCRPQIVWDSKLYEAGKFDKLIKIFLDHTEKIRDIFRGHYKSFKNQNYFPYQPICPKCGKISTTKIYKWDGEFVYFRCLKDAVDYTQGCGYEGKLKPEKTNGKLPWKIEWSCHWQTLGVTIEWSGKDHMTKGGSWEFADRISREILSYPTPQAQGYEHFLIGGRKMSSSKGRGASAFEMAQNLPPQLLRFLMVRINFKTAINFDPAGNTIPNLFDEYDSYAQEFYKAGAKTDHGRIWQLSQIGKIPVKKLFYPRFRDVANYIQTPSVDTQRKFEEIKGSKLTKEEKEILEERKKYTRIWLAKYASEEAKFEVKPLEINVSTGVSACAVISAIQISLDEQQKKYLSALIDLINQKDWKPEDLQYQMYELTKKIKIPAKKAFQAVYQSLLGKSYGPKAAWLILKDKEKILKNLKEVVK